MSPATTHKRATRQDRVEADMKAIRGRRDELGPADMPDCDSLATRLARDMPEDKLKTMGATYRGWWECIGRREYARRVVVERWREANKR